jgi:probable HAF family extracellular repeat protein
VNEFIPVALNERGQVAILHDGNDFVLVQFWDGHSFKGIGGFGGDNSRLESTQALNNRGQLVGSSQSSHLDDWRAFLWVRGAIHDLGTLGGPQSFGVAVNSDGVVVGRSEVVTDGPVHAFIWIRGVMTDLGTLGGKDSSAVAINERQLVVGDSLNSGGDSHAVLWTTR